MAPCKRYRQKKIRTRIRTQPLGTLRHSCKMRLFLVTLMKLMMTSLCNWSKNWNQMKTQCNQVIERSKKPIPKILEGNHNYQQQAARLKLRPLPSKSSLQTQQLKALISTASPTKSKTAGPRPKPNHKTAPSFQALPIQR